MRVVDGALHIRSPRTASGYVGNAGRPDGGDPLKNDGFVDTGDMVELRGGESDPARARYYFAGRRGGIINVGGNKIHPEEIEAVINRHPAVRLSRVSGRRNPITGSIVVAEAMLDENADPARVQTEILQNCRASLKPFQVPAIVRIVPKLELSAGGKLMRNA
jgi:acyl-CoA synthetase (AMP-forming)/AMP-acid ligase II